jgi:hypothetical protein
MQKLLRTIEEQIQEMNAHMEAMEKLRLGDD